MKATQKKTTTTKVILELEEWEAKDLEKILGRLRRQRTVSKSEFSLREKTTGRRLHEALEQAQDRPKKLVPDMLTYAEARSDLERGLGRAVDILRSTTGCPARDYLNTVDSRSLDHPLWVTCRADFGHKGSHITSHNNEDLFWMSDSGSGMTWDGIRKFIHLFNGNSHLLQGVK